jgi:hypothetical protein
MKVEYKTIVLEENSFPPITPIREVQRYAYERYKAHKDLYSRVDYNVLTEYPSQKKVAVVYRIVTKLVF